MDNDPNGVTWLPAWKRHGYESYEAWIESKAGASPDKTYLDKMLDGWEAYAKGEDWPQPQPPPYAADDEGEVDPMRFNTHQRMLDQKADEETPHDPISDATVHMQRIVGDISRLEDNIKDLRIKYWGWQAMAYPVNECRHGPAHFCPNCDNTMEAHD